MDNNPSKEHSMRQKAEELLKKKSSGTASPLSEVESSRLIYELQVHQIELELQNDELRHARAVADAAHEKYIRFYDLAPSGYFTLSRKGAIIELNLAGALMLGKDHSHLLNKHFHFFVSRDTQEVFKQFLEKTFENNRTESCEVILTTSGNQPVYVHLSGIATEGVSQCFVNVVDITEGKQMELAMQQSKTKYQQLAENSTLLVYRISLKPEFKFEYVSPSATVITGYTPEDHYSNPQLGFNLVHPDDRILLESMTKYSKGEPLELRWIRQDGRVIWTEQRNILLFDENNEPYAIEGNATDITDRKNAELGLRKEAERSLLLLGLFEKATALSDTELFDMALNIAVKITDSKIGFFHQVSDNQQEITLTTWNDEARKNCTSVFNNHYPLDQAGNWADCIRQKKRVVYNDYPASVNRKGLPEGHAPVGRMMSIPVVHDEKVRLIFGVGNKSSDYTELDEIQIQEVANELYKILEKREVERDLKKSEDRWQIAIEGSKDGIWDWNMLTGDVFFSNRWKEMIGYGPDELDGKLSEWQNRVHPDDIEAVMFKLQQHFKQQTPDYTSEHRMLCRDGSWKWILDRGKVLDWTVEGKPARMVGTHTDITERISAEETTRKSEEKFRIVANNAFNWEFWEGADGKWIHHSPSCKKLTGYSADDFMGDDELLLKIIHPDDREGYIKHHQEKLEVKTPGSHFFRIITKEGETRHIEHLCQSVFDDTKSFIGIRGSNIDITERKLAGEKLMESEVQYRNLANAGLALIWTSGTDKLCNYFNETWLRFTGRTIEQEMGNGWVEGVHPDDFNRCLETYISAFDKQETFEMEYRLRHSSGEYKWIVDLGTPNYNSKGEFVGYIGHCFDISERKANETALKKLSQAVEQSPVMVCITDLDGKFEYTNPKATELTGYTREELVGQNPHILNSGEKPKEEYRILWETLKSGKEWRGEFHNKKKNGELFWSAASITPIIDSGGNLTHYLAVEEDITERKNFEKEIKDLNIDLEQKITERTSQLSETNENLIKEIKNRVQAEAALRESQEQLELIIKGSNDAPWDWNLDNDNLFYSTKWWQQIGYAPDEIPSNSSVWRNLTHPDDVEHVNEIFKNALASINTSYEAEFRLLHKDGHYVPVLSRGYITRNTTGKPIRVTGTNMDLTERKRAEVEIMKAKTQAEKANHAKSEFLSRMSHELRTPMNSIIGFAQLMKIGELSPKHRKGVNHILNSGKHLLNLINEVLDISGIEAGRVSLLFVPVELGRILRETIDTVHPLTRELNVKLELINPNPDRLFVKADPHRLRQVLLNLVNNAVKYNREGGSVVIKTEFQQATTPAMSFVRISVSDTGPGINPEKFEKLFMPFERIGAEKTGIEGTGLGLMVVKKLMDAMGGRVWVESVPGAGSTFWIELPHSEDLDPAAEQTEYSSAALAVKTKKIGTILYIEDNASNTELVEQILVDQRPSIHFVCSTKGAQAVPLAIEYAPDLILLDLDLPDMKGFEVIKQLQTVEKTKGIPVVVVSADAMVHQIEKLMKAGAKDYLTKPLDIMAFLQVVDEWVGK